MLGRFLSVDDATRVLHTLQKLSRHDIHGWALTGGLATEIHRLQRGFAPALRALNDLDFIAESFDDVPETLGEGFLFRHIHPFDPPNKIMLQLVDPESSLRIDLFRSSAEVMRRTSSLEFPACPIKVISLEDLTARTARLALDLTEGVPTPSKHATDFMHLVEMVDPLELEAAWADHRKPTHPSTFPVAAVRLRDVIAARQDLLIAPEYSKNAKEVCSRCQNIRNYRLADPQVILSILGYC